LYDIDLGCPARDLCTIWPNGEVLPCCTAGTTSFLSLGNISRDTPAAIFRQVAASRLRRVLRREGVGGLLARMPSKTGRELSKRRFTHACHVCSAALTATGGRIEAKPRDLAHRVLDTFD
jgi:hypothetical protein